MTAPRERVAFRFASFERLPLRHAMSGRLPAAPLEGTTGHGRDTDPLAVEENRAAFIAAAGVALADVTVPRQTHTASVAVAAHEHRGRGLYPTFDGFAHTDAVVTDSESVAPAVIVADCVPLVLYDNRRHALAVVHAGWRGTVGGIGVAALGRMREAYGTDPGDVVAGIGPSIGPCCYEVGDEVIAAWRATGQLEAERAVSRPGSSYHFDLWSANRLALIGAGVPRRSIEVSGICVRCEVERYFSYRASRQGIAAPGRMMMVAQLAPR